MSRNRKWDDNENEFLTGIISAHGDKPRNWSENVKAMVKARLADRTESGIYQQTLKILKTRGTVEGSNQEFFLTTGA